MEYLVLARKWRPQTFEGVIGQDHVVKTLKNAILHHRIPHAFTFSGPRGVGKTSVARILAKALNCEKGPAPIPCNTCANCREITGGISMDVREIDGASNRGIDEIRELRENVKFSPISSRYKLFIIDEVHMLTREAFNALLKTLEEPPSHVIFVFATTEIRKIPATILSRCQCFEFRRVSIGQMRDSLRQIAQVEGIHISDKALTWIVEAGDGSLRDAQSIFDQVISYTGAEIQDGHVEEMLSLTDRRFLYRLSGAIVERNAGLCLKIIEEGYYAGLDMKTFYQMLLRHFRNLLFIKIAGNERDILDLGDDEVAMLKEQTEGISQDTLQRLLDMLMAEEERVRKSQNPRIHLETVVVRMAYLEPVVPIDHILAKMEALERTLVEGESLARKSTYSVQETRNSERQAEGSAYGTLHDLTQAGMVDVVHGGYELGERDGSEESLWEEYKAFIKRQSPPLGSKVEKGRFLSYEHECLRIGFCKRDSIFFEDNDDKSRLMEISRDFFRKDVKIKIETQDSDGVNEHYEGRNGAACANGINEVNRDVLHHPLLQKVLDVFEGAVVQEVIARVNHK